MFGYAGKILWVNLEAGRLEERPLSKDYIEDYVGGSGIGAKILADLTGVDFGKIHPLSPANPLIFMTGPLVGSGLPATGRLAACAKSPLTGTYAESSVGGFLGAALKFAGYDGIVFTGKAEKPYYLKITNEEATLASAYQLWGKDTYESCDFLLNEVADEKGTKGAATIGPAGENLLPFASVSHNKGHFLGRTGMGAVMGSKNLKGIIVVGNSPPAHHNPNEVKKLKQGLIKNMKENIVLESLTTYGTNCALDLARFTGDTPIKNWLLGEWEEGFDKINGPAFDAVLTGKKTCYACPVACKREVEVEEGPFKMEKGPGPEYETVGSFGTMCLIDSPQALSKINDKCNRLGMDTITAGVSIAFFIEAIEKGLLPSQLANEVSDLDFGKAEAVLILLEKMANREGCGRLLALGSDKMSKELGEGFEEILTTVKGLEAPMHDPRAGHGMGLAYATGYRGACHMSDLTMPLEQGAASFPSLGLEDYYEGQESKGKGKLVALAQDLGSIVGGAAIFCLLGGMGYKEKDILQSFKTVTGVDTSLEDLLIKGKRIWLLKRILNNLCGVTAKDDKLPRRLITPLNEGSAASSVPDMELMLKDFYEVRNLTPAGKPKKEALIELNLGFAIPWLYTEE